MAELRGGPAAPGGPGMEPRWTRGAKQAVGAAYSTSSRVWFTVSGGVLTETYFPTVDRPQIRDLQLLVTDGRSFCLDERHHHLTSMEPLEDRALGMRMTLADPQGRYTIEKRIIADPHQACVLQRVTFTGDPATLAGLRVYALVAPHLDTGGWGNSAHVAEAGGRSVLVATKGGIWTALAGSVPFGVMSCGFVGVNDGWRDLMEEFRLDERFDAALDGNVALTGELAGGATAPFTLALGFGFSLPGASSAVLESLAVPFEEQESRFLDQWRRASRSLEPLESAAGDGGRLYGISHALLLAHEDKTYPGAFIASLSIPWGERKGDQELGGYHLVWTRDMVNSATALMAAGNIETARRALVYLAAVQRSDGGFDQNFWINGEPYWRGVQLDEAAFPVLLAWRLHERGALRDFDPYPLVLRAAGFLVDHGPATPQERWEENAGHSPSTLAAVIAALICGAAFARDRGDPATAGFLESYADWLEARVERWTVTTRGTLVPGVPRHYIRLCPVDLADPEPDENPDDAVLGLKNRPPDGPWQFPARDVVDPGFLELVRYGLRRPGDPLIEDSLRVVDAGLRVETPHGPCWRRYTGDGYGQRDDGGAFDGWGVGRPWPLLTGERGHYELAAGRDPEPYLRAFEGFATALGLLPEQVWDGPDLPMRRLKPGRPTGAACPLVWAHAEYVKLLRSTRDGAVFDRVAPVAARYLDGRPPAPPEIWKFSRRVSAITPGTILRIVARAPFRLRWTIDEWATVTDTAATPTATGMRFVDLGVPAAQRSPVRFTFYWPETDRWEGRDFGVAMGGGSR